MAGNQPEPGYQHIRFGWAERNLLGSRGLGPTATSFAEDDYRWLRTWHDRLEPVVDPNFQPLGEVPRTLWYHSFDDGSAALLYRQPGRPAGDGRDATAWALLCPPSSEGLGMGEALLLGWVRWWESWETPWPHGWAAPPITVGPRFGDWRGQVLELDQDSGGLRQLPSLLAAALREPERPLSVVLPAERAVLDRRHGLPLRLLWGLYRVLRGVFPENAATGWGRSFSTYEPVAEVGPRTLRPWIAFRAAPGETRHTRVVHLGTPREEDAYRRLAVTLAARLRGRGGEALAGELGREFASHGLGATTPYEERVDVLVEWTRGTGRRGSPSPASAAVPAREEPPARPVAEGRVAGAGRPSAPAGDAGGRVERQRPSEPVPEAPLEEGPSVAGAPEVADPPVTPPEEAWDPSPEEWDPSPEAPGGEEGPEAEEAESARRQLQREQAFGADPRWAGRRSEPRDGEPWRDPWLPVLRILAVALLIVVIVLAVALVRGIGP